VDFSIRSRNGEAIDAVNDTHFTESEESKNDQVEVKAMMIVFFEIRDVIMIEWAPEGEKITQKYYLEVLTKLRERVRKKRSYLWKKKWILHQDNAPAHNALAVKQFLADKCVPVLEQPPPPSHSLDFVSCDLYLFPKLKSALRGTHLSLSMRLNRKRQTC
jgi:hypothetical protein